MTKKPTKGDYLEVLLRTPRTVFSTKDAALLWEEDRSRIIANRLKKYVNAGKLIRIRHGIYAKDHDYDRFELATRIYTPSYLSFETVLTRSGINFQHYESIFVASYVTREIKITDQNFSFIRMKANVLANTLGITHENGIATATPERAFLDRVYVSKEYHFDNVQGLDWKKVFEILPMYHNKKMTKKVHDYFTQYQNSNV